MRVCSYESTQELGSGSYGKVYLIRDKGQMKALKLVEAERGIHDPIEIDILSRFRHPHLMHAEKIEYPPSCINSIGFVLPLAESNLLTQCNKIPTHAMESVIRQSSSAIYFLHGNGILHLDIKLENILITTVRGGFPHIILVSDFGLSLSIPTFSSVIVSKRQRLSFPYQPPEMFHPKPWEYSIKTDVWALGMVYLTLLSRRSPIHYAKTDPRKLDLEAFQIARAKNIKVNDARIEAEKKFRELQAEEFRNNLNSYLTPRYIAAIIKEIPFQRYIPLVKAMLNFNIDERWDMYQVLNFLGGDAAYTPGNTIQVSNVNFEYDDAHIIAIGIGIRMLYTIKTVDAAAIFIAVDLYYRAIPNSLDIEFSYYIIVILSCVFIAYEYVSGDSASITSFLKFYEQIKENINIQLPEVTRTHLIKMQIGILQVCDGIINPPYIYAACRDINEMLEVSKFLFQPSKYIHNEGITFLESLAPSSERNKLISSGEFIELMEALG